MVFHWSQTVEDYYPVSPRPRWGFGRPPHPRLYHVLDSARADYETVIADLDDQREVLYAIPDMPDRAGQSPCWNNIWFSCLDGAALVGLLLSRRPQRYIEVGSGHSTRFVRHAINRGDLPTTLTSIDPQPRAEIDAICDEVIRSPLEDCPLDVFARLQAGDILFFDGSHRVFANSDTTALVFDILPRLAPGVLVHFHDIFLPDDYPPIWNHRLYSEQYLVAALLLWGAAAFQPVFPNYFVCTDPELAPKIRTVFDRRPGTPIPFIYNNGANIPGVSLWLQTCIG